MTLLGLVLALLPGFAWLFFYLKEDPHPEPKRLIAAVFFLGAASAIVAFFAETVANAALLGLNVFPFSIVSLIVLAFVEEFSKFGAAYLAIHRSPDFDEPIDAMIYMVVAALGFATVENLGAIHTEPGQAALISTVFETVSFRFVGATLLHTLASAIIGYYWAASIRNFNNRRTLWAGLLLGSGLHALFNYLILRHGSLAYSLVFVIVIAFFTLADFEKLKAQRV